MVKEEKEVYEMQYITRFEDILIILIKSMLTLKI